MRPFARAPPGACGDVPHCQAGQTTKVSGNVPPRNQEIERYSNSLLSSLVSSTVGMIRLLLLTSLLLLLSPFARLSTAAVVAVRPGSAPPLSDRVETAPSGRRKVGGLPCGDAAQSGLKSAPPRPERRPFPAACLLSSSSPPSLSLSRRAGKREHTLRPQPITNGAPNTLRSISTSVGQVPLIPLGVLSVCRALLSKGWALARRSRPRGCTHPKLRLKLTLWLLVTTWSTYPMCHSCTGSSRVSAGLRFYCLKQSRYYCSASPFLLSALFVSASSPDPPAPDRPQPSKSLCVALLFLHRCPWRKEGEGERPQEQTAAETTNLVAHHLGSRLPTSEAPTYCTHGFATRGHWKLVVRHLHFLRGFTPALPAGTGKRKPQAPRRHPARVPKAAKETPRYREITYARADTCWRPLACNYWEWPCTRIINWSLDFCGTIPAYWIILGRQARR